LRRRRKKKKKKKKIDGAPDDAPLPAIHPVTPRSERITPVSE
jgi:hypothetical protein